MNTDITKTAGTDIDPDETKDMFEQSGDTISTNSTEVDQDVEITLDDLGEVDDQPELTIEQMKKFKAFVNNKINHYKQMGKKIEKRRNKNKAAKKSRKKNRRK